MALGRVERLLDRSIDALICSVSPEGVAAATSPFFFLSFSFSCFICFVDLTLLSEQEADQF